MITSQNGECRMIDVILSVCRGVPRYCVEIGVDAPEGPIQCNTVHLLDRGWDGVLIDEDRVNYPRSVDRFITAENINQVLCDLNVPAGIGVFSIDVDGNDYWIWKALVWNPCIMVIEYNSEISTEEPLVVPYDPAFKFDGTSFFGASARAMVELAHKKGYKLITDVAHVNLFFVRDDLVVPGHVEPEIGRLGGRLVGQARTDPKCREFQRV